MIVTRVTSQQEARSVSRELFYTDDTLQKLSPRVGLPVHDRVDHAKRYTCITHGYLAGYNKVLRKDTMNTLEPKKYRLMPVINNETGIFELKRIEWDNCIPVTYIERWNYLIRQAIERTLTPVPEDIKALYE